MKKLNEMEMVNINGEGDVINGVCASIGVTRVGLWGAMAIFGSSIAKSIIGGPVGTVLGVASIACLGYSLYQNS